MIRCINTFTKHHAFNTTVFSKVGAEDPYAEQVMVMDTLDSIHEKQCLDCLDVKRDLNIPLKTKHGKEQIA
jgi:hypothetical protein